MFICSTSQLGSQFLGVDQFEVPVERHRRKPTCNLSSLLVLKNFNRFGFLARIALDVLVADAVSDDSVVGLRHATGFNSQHCQSSQRRIVSAQDVVEQMTPSIFIR
jgi:hypothetical protein